MRTRAIVVIIFLLLWLLGFYVFRDRETTAESSMPEDEAELDRLTTPSAEERAKEHVRDPKFQEIKDTGTLEDLEDELAEMAEWLRSNDIANRRRARTLMTRAIGLAIGNIAVQILVVGVPLNALVRALDNALFNTVARKAANKALTSAAARTGSAIAVRTGVKVATKTATSVAKAAAKFAGKLIFLGAGGPLGIALGVVSLGILVADIMLIFFYDRGDGRDFAIRPQDFGAAERQGKLDFITSAQEQGVDYPLDMVMSPLDNEWRLQWLWQHTATGVDRLDGDSYLTSAVRNYMQ